MSALWITSWAFTHKFRAFAGGVFTYVKIDMIGLLHLFVHHFDEESRLWLRMIEPPLCQPNWNVEFHPLTAMFWSCLRVENRL